MHVPGRLRRYEDGAAWAFTMLAIVAFASALLVGGVAAHADVPSDKVHASARSETPAQFLPDVGDRMPELGHSALGGHCHPSLSCSLAAALSYAVSPGAEIRSFQIEYRTSPPLARGFNPMADSPPPRSGM